MTSSKRGAAFSIEEDKLLVMAYLDVSQNLIIGINQSRDRLWSRVAATYNEQLTAISRVDLAVDHVWSLLKDQEKFRSSNAILANFIPNRRNIDSSQSDYSPNIESPTLDSGGLSGFAINLDEDNPSGGSCQSPIGIKKAKAKRKATDEHLKDISTMARCTEKMVAVMENAELHRQQLIDVEKQRNAIMAFKEENKILRMNPMCVDESVRAYLIKEQQKIWQKRMETRDGSDGTPTPFGQFFGGTSPSGSDLPPY
ncbi:uncharacterized protein [Primulina eburnea]|uniref:uncharacterized protein n=1 Tax=Primulina eburnea TaxID=1245227 RepID=UPI003C6C783B